MGEMQWTKQNEAPRGDEAPRVVRPNNTLSGWREEITKSYATMKDFIDMDPVSVFQNLSQFSARASEMRSMITANMGREEQNFRIRIIDPFIEECDRQFKLHSRICAIQEMDARLAGGKFA